jgi:hypothetical protein
LSIAQGGSAAVPADFTFRITSRSCPDESIDTATQMFSRTIRDGDVRKARVALTAEQRQRLNALVNGAGIFDYPARFEPPLTSMTEPATSFTIEVRGAGRRHVVQWTDYGSTSAEAMRLRAMLRDVREFFVALPSVRRLPASEIMCL